MGHAVAFHKANRDVEKIGKQAGNGFRADQRMIVGKDELGDELLAACHAQVFRFAQADKPWNHENHIDDADGTNDKAG